MAGRVISANLERYDQEVKVPRQAIAAMRKRFAGSTPVRSSTLLIEVSIIHKRRAVCEDSPVFHMRDLQSVSATRIEPGVCK